MRLSKVKHGHAWKAKLFLTLIAPVVLGARVPDVIRTLVYRPRFFGKRFSGLTQRVMRGPSAWAVGERELFAAFVSRLNQCPF